MAYPAETHSDVVTSWIALTTSYSMQPSCSTLYREDGPSLVAFDPAYGLDVNPTVTCEPEAVTTWWEQGLLGFSGSGHTQVSIGPLTCPQGWNTVDTYVKDHTSTQVMCCPSNFFLGDHERVGDAVNGNCLSSVSKGAILTYGSTSSLNSNSFRMATTTLESASTVGAIAIVGWNVHRASPSKPTASPSSPSSPALVRATTSRTTSSPLSATTTAPPSSSDLSAGLKIGVGIAVSMGAIGIISLIVAIVLFLRRKRQGKEAETSSEHVKQDHVRPNKMDDLSEQRRWELQNFQYYELAHARRVGELGAEAKMGEANALRSPAELAARHESWRR